jgi:hypothetical protein
MEFADGVLRIPVRKAWPLSVSRGCPPGNIRVPERYERCVGSRSGAPGGNIGQQPGRWCGPRLVRRDTAFTRRLFTEVFLKGRPATNPALIQCFMSPETVLPKGKLVSYPTRSEELPLPRQRLEGVCPPVREGDVGTGHLLLDGVGHQDRAGPGNRPDPNDQALTCLAANEGRGGTASGSTFTTSESLAGVTHGSLRRRRTTWVDDLSAAGARQPDLRVVPAAIRVPAPLVLRDEDHQGVLLPKPREDGWVEAPDPLAGHGAR